MPTEMPAVQCPVCWELVGWGDVPEHVESHSESAEIRAVVVEGERPEKAAVGESDPDAPPILWDG